MKFDFEWLSVFADLCVNISAAFIVVSIGAPVLVNFAFLERFLLLLFNFCAGMMFLYTAVIIKKKLRNNEYS